MKLEAVLKFNCRSIKKYSIPAEISPLQYSQLVANSYKGSDVTTNCRMVVLELTLF